MPNWCYTDLTIYDTKENISKLYNNIKEWTSKNYCENDFGTNWLGNVVAFSGIADELHNGIEIGGGFNPCKNGYHIGCRGDIIDINYDKNSDFLNITMQTAWSPQLYMWKLICDKYLSQNYSLIYTADEPNMDLYLSNDPNFHGHYLIDVCADFKELGEGIYNADKETVVSFLQKYLKTEETDLERLNRLLSKSKYADSIFINEWEYCDVEETF